MVAEMYVWLALTMLMPHIRKHRLVDYWATDKSIATPVFGEMMSRDRYHDILQYLHFTSSMRPHPNDRLWKVRPVMSLVLENMRRFFRPYQKLCVDESLILFKGRLSFQQFIPSKRHRFGIKFYVICDCLTGYVLDFVVYTGSDVDIVANDPHGFSGAVVKHLMQPFLRQNHILYMDNYYTSPILSQFLLDQGTDSCGTVRVNRRKYPHFPDTHRGEAKKQSAGEMLAIKWHDKRPVQMLTTVHKGEMVPSGKVERGTGNPILKPDAILDYNLNMKLVDKADMLISAIDCLRKPVNWYRKVFFHVLDIAMLNAYVLYCHQHQEPKLGLPNFEKKVIDQLFE